MGEWARGCIEFLPLLNGANRPPSLRHNCPGRNLRRLRLVAPPWIFGWGASRVPSVLFCIHSVYKQETQTKGLTPSLKSSFPPRTLRAPAPRREPPHRRHAHRKRSGRRSEPLPHGPQGRRCPLPGRVREPLRGVLARIAASPHRVPRRENVWSGRVRARPSATRAREPPLVPGCYDGDVPYDHIGRAWARSRRPWI